MEKTKGFVTIATGGDNYYKMAADLLNSYRVRGKGKYPFAIICDHENEYTALFDDVVLVNEFHRSTVDKLLIRYSPYQETLFMDADILILDNIDDLWDVFQDADDVSAFGCVLPLDSQAGWFTYEGSGKYRNQIKFLLSMHGGIYFFRKNARSEKVFVDAISVMADYATIDFKYFDSPQDEHLMAMSMVINGCKPCEKSYPMIFLPACDKKITVDVSGNIYEDNSCSNAKFIHFSSPRTKGFLYNYLNEINYQQEEWRTRTNYLRIKSRYAMADTKFTLYHNAGDILRCSGFASVVEWLKKHLH